MGLGGLVGREGCRQAERQKTGSYKTLTVHVSHVFKCSTFYVNS